MQRIEGQLKPNDGLEIWLKRNNDKIHPKFKDINPSAIDFQQSFNEYQIAAETGLITAKEKLAEHYLFGWGITQNLYKAFTLFKEAADAGNAIAQYHLGRLYLLRYASESQQPQDGLTAIVWIAKSARQGYSEARYEIALAHLRGFIYKKNVELGLQQLKELAAEKHAAGNASLFEYYKEKEQIELGIPYLIAATELLLIPSLIELTHLYVNEKCTNLISAAVFNCALNNLIAKADAGDDEAQMSVGRLYLVDSNIFPANYALAYRYFSLANKNNHPAALCGLSYFYLKGWHVEKNLLTALKLIIQAYELNDPHACILLMSDTFNDEMFINKEFTETMLTWMRKQARAENPAVILNLAYCLRLEKATAFDANYYNEGIYWFHQAALKGFQPAIDFFKNGGEGKTEKQLKQILSAEYKRIEGSDKMPRLLATKHTVLFKPTPSAKNITTPSLLSGRHRKGL